jgi:hypothetical protein
MKLFNITAQVFKNNDSSKQNLLINEIHDGSSSTEALSNFKLHFPCIEFSLVKILSVEEISQEAS